MVSGEAVEGALAHPAHSEPDLAVPSSGGAGRRHGVGVQALRQRCSTPGEVTAERWRERVSPPSNVAEN